MSIVTLILSAIEQGDPSAGERLLPLVYDELRKLAGERMAQEKPGQTLQATALVHEAYVQLVATDKDQHWNSRGHFFAAAGEAMRRILIETARRKQGAKHGGALARKDLDAVDLAAPDSPEEVLALDEAMQKLTAQDKTAADVVRLRFYAGLPTAKAEKAPSCCWPRERNTPSRRWPRRCLAPARATPSTSAATGHSSSHRSRSRRLS
jgi:RNA polymerase sigma factor (TIGR02999 family)